jgi:hypothetical protein
MKKKKNLLNSLMLSALLGLIALSNCSDNKGNINDNDNVGNHANTPPGAPDSEYPGNRSDSTHHTDSSSYHH